MSNSWVQLFSHARVTYPRDEQFLTEKYRRRRKSTSSIQQSELEQYTQGKATLTQVGRQELRRSRTYSTHCDLDSTACRKQRHLTQSINTIPTRTSLSRVTQIKDDRCRLPSVTEEEPPDEQVLIKHRRFRSFTKLFLSSKKYQQSPTDKKLTHRASLGKSPLVRDNTKNRTKGHRVVPVTSTRVMTRTVQSSTVETASVPGLDESASKRDDEPHTASVEALVRRCADCYDGDGSCPDENFPQVLFLTHLWFMTSEQLLVLFSQLFDSAKDDQLTKKKVFYSIRSWLHEFPHVFDLDTNLVRALQQLQSNAENDDDVDTSIIDLSNKGSYKWMSEAHLSIRPNQVNRKRRKVSLVFNHLEPEELAIHISYLEYKCFRRLTLSDFHNYAVHGAIKDNPKLERAVVLFNNITHWVQCMVLGHPKAQERAVAIAKFVEIAKKLHAMRNFNTLMAIVGALTHTVISRMKKTMAVLPKETMKALEEFVDLLDSKSNYGAYRKAYSEAGKEFKIPIIGILMKDLIALHAALPDRVGDGLINVRKMIGIGGRFQEISYLQRTPFPYEVNRDLVNTLRVSLYLYYSEEEIYQLSISREPRDVKHNNAANYNSPSKFVNMGFGEFARYTCHLDSETIRQHVTAMVTSVFKAYDQNSDGFISEAEFETFIRNFPGLDSFSTVDKDKDGRISISEMLDYFLKISSTRRSEVYQVFKHDFVETTYFHPTFCEECEKLLWGLVKQGWKCKGCGINCHKHCKERIVQECRPKQQSRNGSISSQSPVEKVKRNEKLREKSSVSSESDFSLNGDTISASAVSITEDEAFDVDLQQNESLSTIRSSSLASVDEIGSRKIKLQPNDRRKAKLMSKTPPPMRKVSSSTFAGDLGRVSLQKKMQNILKKKNSMKKVSEGSVEVGTQTAPSILPTSSGVVEASSASPPDTPSPISSFLYGNPSSFKPKRLGSTGEDLTDDKEFDPSYSAMGHAMVGAPASIIGTPQTKTRLRSQLNKTTDISDRPAAERRDSGLSGCGNVTNATSPSGTITPVFEEKAASHFCYPATTKLPSSNAADDKNMDVKVLLEEENRRLRKENETLTKELAKSHDIIKNLQVQVGNMQSESHV
ncbi:uncharacterized protein LOC100175460 isoform X1 [Ciona intestinalis]